MLSKTPEGLEIVRLYYQLGPAIASTMVEDKAFKKNVKEMIEGIMPLVR